MPSSSKKRLFSSFGSSPGAGGACRRLLPCALILLLLCSCAARQSRAVTVAEDPAAYARVLRLAAPLPPLMDRPDREKYGYIVLADDSLNAFIADYTVILPRGTLAALSDDELTCVIAHEIAHQSLGHQFRKRSVEESRHAVFESIGPGAGVLPTLFKPFALKAYSREQELEADLEAAQAVRQLGIPAESCATALITLHRGLKKTGGGPADTHPSLAERIERLRQMPRHGEEKR